MKTTRISRLALIAGGIALTAASCGGGDDSAQDSAPADEGQQTSQASDGGGAAAEDDSGDEDDTGTGDASDGGGDASDSGGGAATSEDGEQLPADADLRQQMPAVSAEDAIATAQKTAGSKDVLHAVELDYSEDASAWQWDVKILDGSTDHEVEIDATTGKVAKHEKESTDDQEKAIDLQDPMTFDKALELATEKSDGPLHGWKYEWDDGQKQYQFDIGNGQGDDEVTVDAETGKVILDS